MDFLAFIVIGTILYYLNWKAMSPFETFMAWFIAIVVFMAVDIMTGTQTDIVDLGPGRY
tara:strand:+ start:453 stop:629 length:177 start_codon:yes stop_codon:yes gene_type:complete